MSLLRTHYPHSKSKKEILVSSFLVAVAAYIFLIVFQPFGTYNFSHRLKYFLLAPYSLITFLAFATINLSLRSGMYQWTILKETLKLLGILSFASLFNYWYNIQFINHTSFSIGGLIYMWLFTLAAGIPVSAIYFLARYLYLKHPTREINLEVGEPAPLSDDKKLYIKTRFGNDELEIAEKDFLFAASEGNYCLVFYQENEVARKQLLRLSLKTLEEQVATGRIIRCHRSFIINTDKITHIKGNAQGYKLSIQNSDSIVPVSRSYVETIRQFVKMV